MYRVRFAEMKDAKTVQNTIMQLNFSMNTALKHNEIYLQLFTRSLSRFLDK